MIKLNNNFLNFFIVACVFLWNIYDIFDCIFQGNCGWRREINIPKFGLMRLIHTVPNLFLGFLLCWLGISYFQKIKSDNIQKNNKQKKYNKFNRHGVKKRRFKQKNKEK